MDIFKAFATDPNLELEGRDVRIGGTDEKPCYIKVARLGTPRYNGMMAQMWEANKQVLDGQDKPAAEAKMAEIVQHCLASCVLLGWNEHVEYQGEKAYSYKTAHAMLSHRDFRELVQREANNFQAYKIHQQEEDAKNSQPA